MKKILSILVLVALLTVPFGAIAESNWWDNIGPTSQIEPTPDPTAKPKLDLKSLFGGLQVKDTPEPEPTAAPEPEPEPAPEPAPEDNHDEAIFWENVLFGLDAVNITASPYGGSVNYACIGDWTVAYGNCDDHYCIFGWNAKTQQYHILAETVVSEFVSTKDGFAYYGEVKSGKFGWMFRDPDEDTPLSLGLNELNSVFWSDDSYLYYYEYGSGTAVTYYRMDHDGNNKKKLGKLNGRAVAQMMDDGSVVVFNSSKNRIQLWKDGEHKTIYDPKDEILNVISTGRGIWVDHRDYFGLLDIGEGKIDFRFDGTLRSYATTHNQVFAIVDDGAMRLNVRMLNDEYQAHAVVDWVFAQDGLTIEVTPGYVNRIVVWGARESMELSALYADAFLPYGYYDVESAKAAGYKGWVGYDDPADIPSAAE